MKSSGIPILANPESEKTKSIAIPPGQLAAIAILMKWTNGSGTITAFLDDALPYLTLKRGATTIQEIAWVDLLAANAKDFGLAIHNNSTTANAVCFSQVILPMSFVGLPPNVLDITGGNELTLQYNASQFPAAASTSYVTGSITLSIQPIYDEGLFEQYYPFLGVDQITKAASSSPDKDLTRFRNIHRLLLREGVATSPGTDSTNDITNVNVMVDGQTIFNSSYFDLLGLDSAVTQNKGRIRSYLGAAATSADTNADNLYAFRAVAIHLGSRNGALGMSPNSFTKVKITCDSSVTGYCNVIQEAAVPSPIAEASKIRCMARNAANIATSNNNAGIVSAKVSPITPAASATNAM